MKRIYSKDFTEKAKCQFWKKLKERYSKDDKLGNIEHPPNKLIK